MVLTWSHIINIVIFEFCFSVFLFFQDPLVAAFILLHTYPNLVAVWLLKWTLFE